VFRGSITSGEKFGRKTLSEDEQGSPPLLSSSPQLAATESGNVYVVWVDTISTSGDSDIVFRASTDGGEKSIGFETLSTDIEGSASSLLLSSSPQLAATENGSVYVAWVDTNRTSGDSDIITKHSLISNGLGFSESIPQNREWYRADKISITTSPQLAATENGSMFLVWVESRLQFKEIFNNGEVHGHIVSIGRGTTLPSPQLTAIENGNVYVVWLDKNSTNEDKTLYFKRLSQFFFERNS
jgi:hypothetical protein